MGSKFVFDKTSGTLKPVGSVAEAHVPFNQAQPSEQVADKEIVGVDLKTHKPISMNENIVQFRENSDYTIFQVNEERTRKTMMIIAGYGLEIKFNMAELRSTEKIEQLLSGLTSMFRKMILEQALSKGK